MFSSTTKSRLGKLAFLPILAMLSIVLVTGCTSPPVMGWSGPAFSEGVAYVGTIRGTFLALSNLAINRPHVEWEQKFNPAQAGSPLACGGRISRAMATYGTPAVAGDRIYIADYEGYIYSFALDGSVKDEYTGANIVASPLIADNTIFIGNTDGEFFALDLQLNEKWNARFKAGDKIWGTAAFHDGVVYFGSSDHKLYAIDADTGKEIWHFSAEGPITSTPTIASGYVYIGANDRKFYAIETATEAERAEAAQRAEGEPAPLREATQVFTHAENWFWTQALVYDGRIWVGSLDGNVYAINENDFDDYKVVCQTNGMIQTPPVLMEELGLIFVGSEDGGVYSIDPHGGTNTSNQLADLNAPVLAPMCVDQQTGVLYIHAQDGTHTLYAVDARTGDTLGSYPTSGEE